MAAEPSLTTAAARAAPPNRTVARQRNGHLRRRPRTTPRHPAEVSIGKIIVHGDDDQVVPVNASARASARLIPHATFKVYPGRPHSITDTHKDQFNQDLLNFLRSRVAQKLRGRQTVCPAYLPRFPGKRAQSRIYDVF